MNVKIAIDWLNFTADRPLEIIARNYCFPVTGKLTPVKGVHGYTNAYENVLGTRVMWHDTRLDMGVHIMYTGSCLNAHLDNNIQAQQIARFHREKGDRCTRIDLALDCVDGNLQIEPLYDVIKNGQYKLPNKRKAALLTSTEGVTLYIGARTSDLFLRIYDKGMERGTDDNWKRIELEAKGSRAMFFVNLLVQSGQAAAGQSAREVIKGMADFPYAAWQEIIGDELLTVGKGENRDKDTKAWLITQCAPAMGKYIARTGDSAIIEQFLAIVAAFSDDGDNPTDSTR